MNKDKQLAYSNFLKSTTLNQILRLGITGLAPQEPGGHKEMASKPCGRKRDDWWKSTQWIKSGNDVGKERSFSHAEALEIADLTSDILLTWYKRQQLPEVFPQSRGHGNRRRYAIEQIVFLCSAKALMAVGVSVKDAMILAVPLAMDLCGNLILVAEQSPMEAFNQLEASKFPWIGVFKMPPDEKLSILAGMGYMASEYAYMQILSGDTQDSLRDWMREIGLASFSVVDKATLAGQIINRIAKLAFRENN